MINVYISIFLVFESMDFKVKKKGDDKNHDNSSKYVKEDIDIAYKFAGAMRKELGNFLRCVVLFGSKAKNPKKKGGDIDILIVVDDVSYYMTAEVVEAYKVIIEKHIIEISKKIHVTTLKFTTFWDYMRVGDPIGLNILRDGVALIDTGFFTPMQMLLYSGKIRPSPEAMRSYMIRSPQAIYNSKWHLLQATLDLYWAVVDASHAAIMKYGQLPPRPSEMHLVLHKLVKDGLIPKSCPHIMKMFYVVSKKILRREIREISAREYENHLHIATRFVDSIKKYVG